MTQPSSELAWSGAAAFLDELLRGFRHAGGVVRSVRSNRWHSALLAGPDLRRHPVQTLHGAAPDPHRFDGDNDGIGCESRETGETR